MDLTQLVNLGEFLGGVAAEIWAKAQRDADLSATDEVRLRAMVSELTYAGVAAAFPRRLDRRTNVRKSFSHRTYRRLVQAQLAGWKRCR